MNGEQKRKRACSALSWAVAEGAMSEADALGVLALASSSGYFRAKPDTEVSSQKSVRAEAKAMSELKKKSDPASLKGTKAGTLLNGVRVKDAGERLSNVKHAVKDRAGNPLMLGGKAVETASERENAVIGCWWKRMMQRAGVPVVFTDFEKSLLSEVVTKGKWCGEVGGTYYGGGAADDFVPNATVKALLDDGLSGGLFLAPVEFDANIVTFPLLHGEVFPLVDVTPVTGRRIQSAAVSNVSMSWATAPGTALQPYNTSNLVREVATPVYPLSGAIEISNELMADSPVNVGSTITALYGERMKSELDRVVIAGSGNGEPQGVMNATGLVTVGSDNGVAGPPTVSDYEGLIFGVDKARRQKDWAPAFVANDTSYRRARGIQVGPGDERRVFGMTHQDYSILDYPFKVQNDIPNGRILFGAWKRYRMYQRAGAEITVTREGRALALSNCTLVVVRSRWGGQAIDGAAFAQMTDAQS